jgi:hypothetical protein
MGTERKNLPGCEDFYEDFYHSLAKMYVSLVDSPFVLERFCLKLYRQERFGSQLDLEIIRNIMDELQTLSRPILFILVISLQTILLKIHFRLFLQLHSRTKIKSITLILLNELRSKVSAIKPRDRKYWDSKDMLNKVATYSRIHFIGTYKDLWTVPTKAQRLIFDLLKIEYHWKGETLNAEELKNPEGDAEQKDEET